MNKEAEACIDHCLAQCQKLHTEMESYEPGWKKEILAAKAQTWAEAAIELRALSAN